MPRHLVRDSADGLIEQRNALRGLGARAAQREERRRDEPELDGRLARAAFEALGQCGLDGVDAATAMTAHLHVRAHSGRGPRRKPFAYLLEQRRAHRRRQARGQLLVEDALGRNARQAEGLVRVDSQLRVQRPRRPRVHLFCVDRQHGGHVAHDRVHLLRAGVRLARLFLGLGGDARLGQVDAAERAVHSKHSAHLPLADARQLGDARAPALAHARRL
mmetsp:Transcript_18396/g.42171  ORF Transcript_18396/g.42171 Transcript_18396/m.42171 type:complete len:218 (-) Transcript_18396:739-1392(-)